MKNQERNLIQIHAIGGIIFGLLFYVIMFFGVFSLFQNYIKAWEKPSRHFSPLVKKEEISLDKFVNPILENPDVPKNNLKIRLPISGQDEALVISPAFSEKIVLNPITGKKLKEESSKITSLSYFLHNMHTGWQIYKNVGFTIFGLVAVASIFLMLVGVIQVIRIKYSNNGTSIVKKSSKWHRRLSLWFFLPILIIFVSGAALNLQVKGIKSFSSPITYFLSDGKASFWTGALGSILFPNPEIIKKSGKKSEMLSLEELYKKARDINPNIIYSEIILHRWNDATASIEFKGYDSSYPFFNGYNNLPSVTLNAVNGTLVEENKVFNAHWTRIFFDFVNYLHFAPFWGFILKFILALVVIIFTIGTAFGIWLWLEKKARVYGDEIPFYHWVGRLSITVIVGVFPATATAFLMQWLLPLDLSERIVWQEGSFFLMWLFTALISFARFESYRATKDILYLGSILFILAPVLHWIMSDWNPIELVSLGLLNILGVDLGLLFVSLCCFILAYKIPENRKEAKLFWKGF